MANLEISRSKRLDQYVVDEMPRLSRAYAVRLIEDGKVLVSGQAQKPGYKLRPNDEVVIDFDESLLEQAEPIDLPVLYEDDNVIVVNKPAGVISHARGRYWDESSVASFIRDKVATDFENDPERQPVRAGIVHRLDRATSGIMICARNQDTLSYLQKQFGDRTVQKAYTAIVLGHLDPQEAVIDMPIERNPKTPSTFRVGANGKTAQTEYKVLASSDKYDLVQLKPKTGRTHQLRVHLKQVGHPIVGDHLYDGEPSDRLYLHAHRLELELPGGERRVFESPLPEEFQQLMDRVDA